MEQRDKAIENQKEDRKAEGKFWIILILSGIGFGLMIAGFFLPIGILPFILVTLLWMAQSITYMVKTRKLV